MTLAPVTPPVAALPAEALPELVGAVEDLAGHFALQPLLQRVLRRAVALLDGSAGSISTVDEAAGTYRKEADLGVVCREGSVFPLTEGTTGAVMRARGPVVFERYADVPGGHLGADEGRAMLATVAVPITWAGDVIGACVIFSRDPGRRFTASDVSLLQLFAGHAAVALTNARLHTEATERTRRLAVQADRERAARDVHDSLVSTLGAAVEHVDALRRTASSPIARAHLEAVARATRDALARTRRSVLGQAAALGVEGLDAAVTRELAWLRATSRVEVDLVTTGDPGGLGRDVALVALHALQEVLANVADHAGATHVRVGLLCPGQGVTLLVSDDGRGFDPAAAPRGGIGRALEVVGAAGGSIAVETTPSWGTRVRIELPEVASRGRDGHDRPGETSVRVVVAEARPLVRAGLVRMLTQGTPAVTVVAEASSIAGVTDALAADGAGPAAVVVIGCSGAASEIEVAVRTLRTVAPRTGVVALLDTRPGPELGTALTMLRAAVVGLDAGPADLARVVAAASRGEVVVGVDAGPRHVAGGDRATGDGVRRLLSPRESQVADLVAAAASDRQVARDLGISVKTVEKHVGSILRKTGLPNRTAVAAALAR